MTETTNRMMQFMEQFRELTHGICTMGAGPYGIGVSTDKVSLLRPFLVLTPDPFLEKNSHMADSETCAVEIQAFLSIHGHIIRDISTDDLLKFSQEDDPGTRIVAEAILRMNESKHVFTVLELQDTFDILARRFISDQDGRTDEERAFIDSLAAPKADREMTMTM